MSITQFENAFVNPQAGSVGLSQIFASAGAGPAYLVLTALDRAEYTAGNPGVTGSFSGNDHALALRATGGDARGAGIVFTYQQATGRYYSTTYGYLDQLTYLASASAGDVTNLSLFGTNDLGLATYNASNAYAMAQADAAVYLGSATVVTQPRFVGSVPAQATPASIAAVANTLVGQAWNTNGCWVLASTIAADAGASLPVQSSLIDQPGQANGEWIVAFNGPAGQTGNWQSMVTAGEMVVIGTSSTSGHITTCVAGSGSTAMLVDNTTFENSAGHVLNLANDGSSNDIIVAAAHAASQEWAGIQASSVVIYELDTPIVTAGVASDKLAVQATQALGPLFATADPGSKAITQWQVYDTAASDTLLMNGASYQSHSAASALTATSLQAVSLLAGSAATADMVAVRAYNGAWWGDWATLAVTIAPSVAAPPVLNTQTAAVTWFGGRAISLTLPSGTFTDPQGQHLVYSASLGSGQALPSWLSFNTATATFTGVASTAAQTLNLAVKATDSSGLSATNMFQASVLGAPVLAAATPNQVWTEGSAVSFTLPSNAFVDPQGQHLVYAASQSSGQALPTWLSFNTTSKTFSGTPPATAQTLGITVTATDSSGLSATETFIASVRTSVVVARPGVTVSAQTANQVWTDGQRVNFMLPSSTFTDALGLKMTFAAYQMSGPNVTSWLHFNAAASTLSGTVPTSANGTAQLAVVASDALHMRATDMFSVFFAAASAHTTANVHVSAARSLTLIQPPPALAMPALHT